MRVLCLLLLIAAAPACQRRVCCDVAPRPVAVDVKPEPDQVFLDVQCARILVKGRMHELTKRGAPPAPGATFAKRLTDEEVAARYARWKAEGAEIVQAPKLLAVDQQVATIMIGESVTGAKPGEPEFLGTFFRVTPTVRGDDVRVEYHHRIKSDPGVLRPDMTKQEWASAVAAMPYAEADTEFVVPSGGAVLIQSGQQLPHKDGNYWIETLVKVQRLPYAEASTMRIELPPVEDSLDSRK